MSTPCFGEIPGVHPGAAYVDRRALAAAGVHRPLMAGICGTAHGGAESIVVNGGYVDDLDFGSELIYTGAGGNDTGTKKQIGDQSLEHRPNAALVTSELSALPVRTVRGHRGDAAFSPNAGYRYDGLFRVTEHWLETGRDGFKICRFRLVELTREACGELVETNVRTPLDIFHLPQHLVVPIFQRPYVWDEADQWAPLWQDIRRVGELRLADPYSQATHFLGAVVVQAQELGREPSAEEHHRRAAADHHSSATDGRGSGGSPRRRRRESCRPVGRAHSQLEPARAGRCRPAQASPHQPRP